jgi:tetratricopeptide (TPR) repeat protein
LHLARQLAKVDQALGDYGEASLYLKRGLAYAFQLGDDDQQVLVLYDLSVLSLIQGHYGTAQAYLNAALPLAQGERQADLLALVLYGQGQVAYLRNNLDDAESYLTEALALARARHTEGRVMDTLLMLGQISEARTKFGLAQNYYLQVLHLAGQAKTRPMEAAALEHLGQLFGRRSDFLTARSYLNKAVNLNRELLYSPGLSSALLAYGEMELALGNPGPAKAAIVEGLTLAQEMGLVALQLGGILAMLALLAQQGPVEALLPMLGMVQRHPACHADLYRKSVDLLATWPVDSHSKSRGITQGRTLTLEGVMEHLLVGKRA